MEVSGAVHGQVMMHDGEQGMGGWASSATVTAGPRRELQNSKRILLNCGWVNMGDDGCRQWQGLAKSGTS